MNNLREVKLGDLAYEVSERVANPSESGYERFVGLEHLDSGSFYVNRWGSTSDVKSSMKLFKKGDILFARRNTYLKRASVAKFDGVCSGDIIVLREYDSTVKEITSLIMNLDRFWDFAISNSAGTMSKRAKWRDIEQYIACIPNTKEEQEKTVEMFKLIGRNIISKELLKQKIIKFKERFVEQYNSNKKLYNKEDIYKIKDICSLNPKKEVLNEEELASFIAMEDVSNDAKIIHENIRRYKEVNKGFTSFKEKDILVAKITPCFENGKGAICKNLKNGIGFGSTEFHVVRCSHKVIPEYVYINTLTKRFRILGEWNMTGSAGQRRVPKEFIENYEIYVPPIDEQIKIVSKYNHIDKTLILIENNIKELENLKSNLLNRLFNKN